MARVTLVHGIDTNAIPSNFGRIWMRKYGMADDVGIASVYYNFEYDHGLYNFHTRGYDVRIESFIPIRYFVEANQIKDR